MLCAVLSGILDEVLGQRLGRFRLWPDAGDRDADLGATRQIATLVEVRLSQGDTTQYLARYHQTIWSKTRGDGKRDDVRFMRGDLGVRQINACFSITGIISHGELKVTNRRRQIIAAHCCGRVQLGGDGARGGLCVGGYGWCRAVALGRSERAGVENELTLAYSLAFGCQRGYGGI